MSSGAPPWVSVWLIHGGFTPSVTWTARRSGVKLSTRKRPGRCASITKDTVLFVDEPETNLHPRASAVFTQTLFRLAQAGVQVYLATHSYFVLKQL